MTNHSSQVQNSAWVRPLSTKELFLIIPLHNEPGDNPKPKIEDLTVSSIICDRCQHLD